MTEEGDGVLDARDCSVAKTSIRTEDRHDLEAGLTVARHAKLQLRCPLTKEPFREPVVHPSGQTYELEAIQEQFVNVHCYPNRALKKYLEPHTDPAQELEDADGIFYCPLSHLLFRDPVIDPEGNTFERHFIHNWIQSRGDSPITRTPLHANQLYDNSIILLLLLQTVLQSNTTNKEEIEEWKREISPNAEPTLTLEQIKLALQNPPAVPNPPLEIIRRALAPPPVPNPTLEDIEQALADEPEPQTVRVNHVATSLEQQQQLQQQQQEEQEGDMAHFLREMEQLQHEEAERQRQRPSRNHEILPRSKTWRRVILLFLLVLALTIGLFALLLLALKMSSLLSFFMALGILFVCCLGSFPMEFVCG